MDDIYTKKSLISKLKHIREIGWVSNRRHGNSGDVGNTLEDLLGLQENNLPIPNAAEWELKCQRASTNSLVTLFHIPLLLYFIWSHLQQQLSLFLISFYPIMGGSIKRQV